MTRGSGRQRAQEGLFLCKIADPAAFPFLERLAVESLHTVVERLIQLRQRQKLAVPQSRQNEGGDDAHSALHHSLVLGRADSGRQDRRAIVLRQFLTRLIEDDLVLSVLLDTGFQVVALDDPCNAAEVFEGIHMGSAPCLLVHGEEGLHIAVAAVGQGRHEHIGRDCLAGVRIDDSGGIARRAALVAVFQPQQVQGDAAALKLLVSIGVVRHLVDGFRATCREQALRELPVRHSLRQRPFQAAVRRPLQRCSHGIPGALAAGSNLSLVEPQSVEPEDLTGNWSYR